jgi:hypothetical protein
MSAIELTPDLIEGWIKEPNRRGGAEDSNGVLHVGGCADYAYVLAHHLYARFQNITAPKLAFETLTARAIGEILRDACVEHPTPVFGDLNDIQDAVFQRHVYVLARLQDFAAPVAETLETGYTNYRGEWSMRRIQPVRLWVGSTDWHPEPGLLLEAIDLDKNETRHFAVKDFGPKREATPIPAKVAEESELEVWKAEFDARLDAIGKMTGEARASLITRIRATGTEITDSMAAMNIMLAAAAKIAGITASNLTEGDAI